MKKYYFNLFHRITGFIILIILESIVFLSNDFPQNPFFIENIMLILILIPISVFSFSVNYRIENQKIKGYIFNKRIKEISIYEIKEIIEKKYFLYEHYLLIYKDLKTTLVPYFKNNIEFLTEIYENNNEIIFSNSILKRINNYRNNSK